MLSLPFGLSHNTNFSWGPFYFSVKWNTGFSSLSSHQSYQSNDFLQLRYLSLSCCFLCAWVFMCMRASWSIAVELNNQPAGVGDGPRAPADCRAPQLLLQTDRQTHTYTPFTPTHTRTCTPSFSTLCWNTRYSELRPSMLNVWDCLLAFLQPKYNKISSSVIKCKWRIFK